MCNGWLHNECSVAGSFPNIVDDQDVVEEEEEDKDEYLHYLEQTLKRIHAAFYQCYDKLKAKNSKEVPDVKTIIPYVKQKVLAGTRIVFSGMIPMNQKLEMSQIYKVATAFGAIVQEKIVTKETATPSNPPTTHLVAAKWGTSKVHKAAKVGNIKIINSNWFWCCVERWELESEVLFPLQEEKEVEFDESAETSNLGESSNGE